jgi:hypothetical protein
VESGAQHQYEFTTPRVVWLVIGIVLWVLLSLSAAARENSDPSSSIGYLLGSLLISLFVAWIVRSLYRLARRRPVIQPAWTPGLFLGAALFQFLSVVGNSAPPS